MQVRCRSVQYIPKADLCPGWVHLPPGSQNGGVANSGQSGWNGFLQISPRQTGQVSLHSTSWTIRSSTWPAPQADPWLLTENACYPSTLTQDPGFALLTWDHYYGAVPARLPYSVPPTLQFLDEEYPKFVRDDQTDKILVDEGNSTRKATDEEMKCQTDDCAQELEEYDQAVEETKEAARYPNLWK
ncbi:hypothetical protein P175DRAFT_0524868 [Aspergillus ochraceoroseus IBT 24754]|uniref:Uncharacterized protein n=1 Tax=Aspergillus ochraceoroseus IBT 24754 TaxID=1392256 RepID=A0A2T5LSM2_9EURO|nr:uncharacterized protein P175DRAFT_0524868 [Aspergillus ochraceoroseus IBT 24754]PTU19275.1 hypothetical protein P175DRAFT_0524868 [Aspergillus ochraceoroseus IBT 24754]